MMRPEEYAVSGLKVVRVRKNVHDVQDVALHGAARERELGADLPIAEPAPDPIHDALLLRRQRAKRGVLGLSLGHSAGVIAPAQTGHASPLLPPAYFTS